MQVFDASEARERRPSMALVWTALLAVWIVWGSTYLAIRVGVRTIPPLLMASARFLVAGTILYLIVRRRDPRRLSSQHWRSAFLIGGALLLGGNGLVSIAEQSVPSGIAALIIASVPLFLASGDRVFFGKRLSWVAVVGLVVGFAGVALLVGQSVGGRFDLGGMLLLIGASISWASGSLYARAAPQPDNPVLGAAMQMMAGSLILVVVAGLTGEFARLDLGGISLESFLGLVYLIVFGSWVGFVAYVWLLKHVSVSLVGTYAYVNPVVAVLLGWAILGEAVTARTLVAGGIVIIGVALIVAAREPKPLAGDPAGAKPPVRHRLSLRRSRRVHRSDRSLASR
ncbi:MAG TPA: EamA family transporter [Actinomycetota bacterium]|nr:EamA family transporter [Actinomycetota bacterium]